jgi:hypothetical protein
MGTKQKALMVLVVIAAGIVLYISVIYPRQVKETCKKASLTFPKEVQEQFYRNCVAESGANPFE